MNEKMTIKEKNIAAAKEELAIRVLRNGLLICGCVLLIPAIGFQTSLAICMIIYSLNLEDM